jgi:hypothetical protein
MRAERTVLSVVYLYHAGGEMHMPTYLKVILLCSLCILFITGLVLGMQWLF